MDAVSMALFFLHCDVIVLGPKLFGSVKPTMGTVFDLVRKQYESVLMIWVLVTWVYFWEERSEFK